MNNQCLEEGKNIGAEKNKRSMISGIWQKGAITVNETGYKNKSLCKFVVNIAVGCAHKCTFCLVPASSVNKQKKLLGELGVQNPDAQWGDYVFLRPWDEGEFLKSLAKAEETNIGENEDGNRAIMFCSMTDPYPIVPGAVADSKAARALVRRALRLIRDNSTLRVRILTRSPLAKKDFELFKSFGDRLLFGMSLPTLDERLSRIYEPHAPSVSQRLATLKAAKAAGLNVFVAIAPTYAECDEADLRKTLLAIKDLDPVTIFHEPINIRAENVARIKCHAAELDVELNTSVFNTRNTWRRYALDQLFMVQRLAEELDIADRLKLWPDEDLAAKGPFMEMRQEEWELKYGVNRTREQEQQHRAADEAAYERHLQWLKGWWAKVSEWPGQLPMQGWSIPELPKHSPFDVSLEQEVEAS